MTVPTENASFAEARKMMVDRHVRPADVTRIDVINAFLAVPRETFFPKAKRALAYAGETVAVTDGRSELDPRVFAKMLQALALEPSDLALIVGAGGGYAPAVAAHLASTVVALETEEELAAACEASLAKVGAEAVLTARGPLEAGWPEHQPYNAILVYGGIVGAPPAALTDQLGEAGRIVAIRMDDGDAEGALGRCVLGVKSGNTIGYRPIFDAAAPILPGFTKPTAFEF